MIKERFMKSKNLHIDVEVKFIPFPCEDARQEAYRTHARLWLRARERELKSKEGKTRLK